MRAPLVAFLFTTSPLFPPPSPLYRFSTSIFPLRLSRPGRLSLLFTKYSLTKKKWDFLLIEDQSSKVSSSKPAPSISRP